MNWTSIILTQRETYKLLTKKKSYSVDSPPEVDKFTVRYKCVKCEEYIDDRQRYELCHECCPKCGYVMTGVEHHGEKYKEIGVWKKYETYHPYFFGLLSEKKVEYEWIPK